jgi:hypothetical protein
MKTLDEILTGFPEDENKLDDPEEYQAFRTKIWRDIELPSFYTFDDFKPIYTIHLTKTVKDYSLQVLDSSNNPIDKTFEYFVDAYDYIEKDLKADVQFAGDAQDLMGTLGYEEPFKEGRPRSNQMYFSHTWKDTLMLAKTNYFHFLKLVKQYEDKPRNFPVAWNFINSHPAFWIRNAGTNNWTLFNNKHISMYVFGSASGEAEVSLEHGSANKERTAHYGGDADLEVSAESYETAIIMLARAVHKKFNYDGSRK